MEIKLEEIAQRVKGHHFWLPYLSATVDPTSTVGLHLAIFEEPFLSLTMSGEKTVESRFSRNRCAPYGQVVNGDIILIKEVAGPICGVTLAKRIWYYDLIAEPIERIKNHFGAKMCANDAYWVAHANALYATLIELEATAPIMPLRCDKQDRRGWVPLRSRQIRFQFV